MATVGESQNLHMTMPKALRTNVKMPAVQQTGTSLFTFGSSTSCSNLIGYVIFRSGVGGCRGRRTRGR
jgi:hypothetical protein